jgi:hypothetical protein
MKHILIRHAEDDFHAMVIAQGMTNAGAEVISVAFNGTRKGGFNGSIDISRFIVFGRFEDPLTCDEIDAGISDEKGKHPNCF